MRKYLKQLKPTSLDDLIAMNALYRPGPMKFIPEYIDRKHGRKEVSYPHPDLEKLLRPTYGIMIYQEQIMKAAQIIANYSLGEADLLRRAMGKKKTKVMDEQREIFVEKALANGVEEGQGPGDLRHDGRVRQLRIQQVALGRLLRGGLPDRLLQGQLSRRVHGGGAQPQHGRHRQGVQVYRGVLPQRHYGRPA
ncbi:MAG: hypothetical protein U5K31_05320 [Balneolaceae bacterium]|nr:hypothetical protein [Balneolaceae bacterium]